MSVWGVGANMLLYLAGLQSIPTQLYEAATIDGANAWQRFRAVTVPMLSPTIFFNVTISLIGAFQFFTQAFVMKLLSRPARGLKICNQSKETATPEMTVGK